METNPRIVVVCGQQSYVVREVKQGQPFLFEAFDEEDVEITARRSAPTKEDA